MNWWVVMASTSIEGQPAKAVVCEERALNWVRDDLKKSYPLVRAVPAECHWTAQVVFPTHPHDVDGTGVRW